MGTVPIGTGALRTIHSRVSWMLRPVLRSMTVSAPQRMAQVIFSTSSSMEEVTAELPMLALIFTRKLRPMIIGSLSGWLILAGVVGRPPAGSAPTDVAGRPAAPLADPLLARTRQPFLDVELERGIAVRAGCVVDAQRRIFFKSPAGKPRGRERDLAHADAVDVDLAGVGELPVRIGAAHRRALGAAADGKNFGHALLLRCSKTGRRSRFRFPTPALSGSGSGVDAAAVSQPD